MGDISLTINVFNVESESSAALDSCFFVISLFVTAGMTCGGIFTEWETISLEYCVFRLSLSVSSLFGFSFHPQQGLPVLFLLIDFLI